MTGSAAAPQTVAACAIAVMGKASTPGRAKTRLMPSLTAEHAAQLNTAFLKDSVGNVIEAGRSADVAVYTAYGPAGSEQFFRDNLPAGVGLIECSHPDFGDCLFHALTAQLGHGHSAACVLNSDSPSLPTAYLIEAAKALATSGDRIVLGPSEDGGYYFLGVKRAHRTLFNDIDWSTSRVCQQTCDRAAALGLPIVWLNSWFDVDDAQSLSRLQADLDRHPDGARCTRVALQRIRESLARLATS